jgi:hypothetical protein
VPSGITEIDLLDEKIACGQLIERYRCWHLSKVTHKSLRLATRCQTQPLAILRRPMRDHSRRPWPWRPRLCAPRSPPPDLRRDRSLSASEICGRGEVTVSLAAGRRSRRARAAGFTASVGPGEGRVYARSFTADRSAISWRHGECACVVRDRMCPAGVTSRRGRKRRPAPQRDHCRDQSNGLAPVRRTAQGSRAHLRIEHSPDGRRIPPPVRPQPRALGSCPYFLP